MQPFIDKADWLGLAERDLALLANHLGLEPKMRVMGEKKLPEKGEVALLIDPPA